MKLPTFLKWAGGKRKLIEQIDPALPNKIERYFEPFLGGGSMFFYIKQKYNPKFCLISDINKDLIDTYKAVRDHPIDLIKYLKIYKKKNSERFYYKLRKDFNLHKIEGLKRSAAFIFLNKNAFNGLYRVNNKGEFNVPYGYYKNPEIFSEGDILFASSLLKDALIECIDYEKISSDIGQGDFIYLDPCYDPLKKTSFAKYTPKRFTDEDNERLSNFVCNMKKKGALVLLSNNLTNNVDRLYPKEEFKRVIVYCSRSINSIGNGRGKIPELLISNY